MSYTVLSVAYPFTPVGPDATGGSEHILSLLDRQLTANGHRSLVLAVQGSQVHGELIASPACSTRLNDEIRRWGQSVHRRLLAETLSRYKVDLVHMHSLDFHAYMPEPSVPTLATLHLPISWYPPTIIQERRTSVFMNCVSASQQQDCPDSPNLLGYVRNGIDLDSFPRARQKDHNGSEQFVLALGRICPEKGFHVALDAAEKAGVPLVLAGELFPYEEHLRYFDKEIAPRLNAERKFIGPVGAEKKRELLRSASALLLTSSVAETSSLVTMEALASGTPVIAFPVGAVPELVEDGKNGFLVNNAEEMTAALQRVRSLKAEDCRASVNNKYDFRTMYGNYMKLYDHIIGQAALNQTKKGLSQVPAYAANLS